MTQTRKTRLTKKGHRSPSTALQTIPELRRSFDYIDEFVKHRISSGTPKEQLVKEVQREWLRVFSKRLQKKNATAFVEHMLEQHSHRRGIRATRSTHATRGTRRRIHGGVAPFMNPTTQAGVYLASGTPPTPSGQYPMANGAPSAYGSLTAYITSGFQSPEFADQQDPIKGQSVFPTQPPPSMGSNVVRGGTRKKRGGSLAGSVLTQAFTRPIPDSTSTLYEAQSAWMGRTIGPSPDQVQRTPSYLLGSLLPTPVNLKIDV